MSKFSKVSLFSGLNQLQDITLDARWSALCGYTDDDIDTVFAPELPGLDRDEIRRWYNVHVQPPTLTAQQGRAREADLAGTP